MNISITKDQLIALRVLIRLENVQRTFYALQAGRNLPDVDLREFATQILGLADEYALNDSSLQRCLDKDQAIYNLDLSDKLGQRLLDLLETGYEDALALMPNGLRTPIIEIMKQHTEGLLLAFAGTKAHPEPGFSFAQACPALAQ